MSAPLGDDRPATVERRRRYRRGLSAERYASAALMLRGYRILARRYKTSSGEIDLVTLKGRRVGFVEVKRRATTAACESAITERSRLRIRRAADIWFARNPQYQGYDVGLDLMFVVGWRWPRLLSDAL